MTKCNICNRGLNSTYVRTGHLGSLRKIGYSCLNCDLHFDLKLYTVNEKLYTDSQKTEIMKRNTNWPSMSKVRVLRPGFEPGIVALRGRNA